jgi:hypothetical protein
MKQGKTLMIEFSVENVQVSHVQIRCHQWRSLT